MDDHQIISQFNQRSQCAIELALERYGSQCRAAARRVLPDERDVEECVSDALLRAWNAIPPECPRHLGAYLQRITRNLALDRCAYHAAAQRSTALTEAFSELEACLPSRQDDPQQQLEFAELTRFLKTFLRQQSRDNRRYFIRRYWYGQTISEIAAGDQVSPERVKSSLFRTRNRLRQAMQQEGLL